MAQQTVLIIDDHPGVRGLLVTICNEAGFKAVTADTCVGGVSRLRDTPCALVILDITMSDLAGEEALAAVHKVRPQVPVIVTTDHGIDDEVKRLLGAGASLCLEKPFDVDFVEKTIRNTIR